MTQDLATQRAGHRPVPPMKSMAQRLSLSQPAPADWHEDRPAYAGDPDMDWINLPEPPREPKWGLKEHHTRKT